MKKNNVASGLNDLLNPTAAANVPQTPDAEKKTVGNYKLVCYNLAPDVIDKIRYIAHYDRKKINEVVTEAFEQYAASWKPTTEKAKKL